MVAQEFRTLLTDDSAERGDATAAGFPLDAPRYLFCQGLLRSKRESDQTEAEVAEGIEVNFGSIARVCHRIIATNPRVRICIIGSESGYRGSFDGVYAKSKARMHAYIESIVTGADQQIVGISPSIIGDAGMTTRREDIGNLEDRRLAHPKHRFVTAAEVAFLAHALLYGPTDYVSGTVVRMHGGLL